MIIFAPEFVPTNFVESKSCEIYSDSSAFQSKLLIFETRKLPSGSIELFSSPLFNKKKCFVRKTDEVNTLYFFRLFLTFSSSELQSG